MEMDVSVGVGTGDAGTRVASSPQPAIRPVKPSNRIAASDLNIGTDLADKRQAKVEIMRHIPGFVDFQPSVGHD